ncbi:MAG: GGDEF domain-containing protein [Lachnospiraceae bacterium]|nr:GGDEF domain-containing protein [Lachnospiraceae bacterium]
MRIIQITVSDTFRDTIETWADEIHVADHSALFHIYAPYDMPDSAAKAEQVCNVIREYFPTVPVVGCSATGEIVDGRMTSSEIAVTLMLFESQDTHVEVLTYYEIRDEMNASDLLRYISNMEHLQGVEILTSAVYERLESTGAVLDHLPEHVEIFGSVAVGDETHPAYVFSRGHEASTEGTVFVFYIGEDLHLSSSRMFGWKSIGYPLEVTRSEGSVVYELNHKPAYEVYNHYLHIEKGEHFFYEALEFPWEVEVDEETGGYIRHAKSVNSDGSIVMSSNIPQGSKVRLAYGDPRRMVEQTIQAGLDVQKFGPQVLLLVNCMGRMLFWGNRSGEEVSSLSKYVPVTGFSALGEIMRTNGTTLLNNLSIVAVAMREGPIQKMPSLNFERMASKKSLPITARLAIFINTITEELMEKNQQLNEALYKISHDYLTHLLNRGAIERMIVESKDNKLIGPEDDWYLVMFDIDDFKLINDTYGHGTGDQVLEDVANYMIPLVKNNPKLDVGRWGGEEFMFFGFGYTDEEILQIAETLRCKVKSPEVMRHPISASIGITKHRGDEPELDTINRVDELLYRAKNQGKDQICADL